MSPPYISRYKATWTETQFGHLIGALHPRDSYRRAERAVSHSYARWGESSLPDNASHLPRASRFHREFTPMLDAIFIVAGIAFFLATAVYADGCDRL